MNIRYFKRFRVSAHPSHQNSSPPLLLFCAEAWPSSMAARGRGLKRKAWEVRLQSQVSLEEGNSSTLWGDWNCVAGCMHQKQSVIHPTCTI